jgi:hypothetical protein
VRHKRILGRLKAPPANPEGNTLATYDFTSAGWATFGLALEEGAATGGVKVGSLTTQTNVLRTWGDGSIRHCLVTADIPSTGELVITDDAQEAGSLTPTWPSATTVMVVGGVTYTATLPAFTAADSYVNGPHLRECKVQTAFTGGSSTDAARQVQCFWYIRSYSDSTHQVSVVLKNGDVEAADADRVIITSLVVNINGSPVYTFTATAGTNTLSTTGNTAFSGVLTITSNSHGLVQGDAIQLTSGPQSGETSFIIAGVTANTCQTYYSGATGAGVTGFTENQTNQSWQLVLSLWYGTAYCLRFDVGGFAEATYVPDLAPFQDSYALIEFGAGEDNTTYTDTGRAWAIPGLGSQSVPLAGSTGDEQLGHYPQWVAVWQEHLTQNQFAHMLNCADRNMTLPGRFTKGDGTIVRHRDTGWENFVFRGDAGANGPDNALAGWCPGFEFDPAHHGSHYYVPYVMTGRREYLDCMKELEVFMAQFYNGTFDDTFANHRWQLRGGGDVFLGASDAGARGWGWNLRGWSDAASIIPDADDDKSYFVDVITDNCEWAETYATEVIGDPLNVFGVMGSGTEGYYSTTDIETRAMLQFVFQQPYLAFGIHRCKQHGFMSTSLLRDAIANTVMLQWNADPTYPKEWGMAYGLAFARQALVNIERVQVGNPAVIATRGAHALETGDSVTLSSTDSTPAVNSTYTVTVTSDTTFTIPVNVTVQGSLNTGLISGCPCDTFFTNSDGSTTPFKYYDTWSQVYASTQLAFGGATNINTGITYDTQQYFVLQCAVAAGITGAADALAYAAARVSWPSAEYGPFSMARL